MMTRSRSIILLATILAGSALVAAQGQQQTPGPVSIFAIAAQPPDSVEPGPAPAGAPGPGAPQAAAAMLTLNVTVTDDKGKPVTNLKKEDFQVQEDGKPREIATFRAPPQGKDLAAPVSLGLLIDISSTQDRLAGMRTAVDEMTKKLSKEDEYFFVEFSSTSNVTVPWTTDRNSVMNAIRRIQRRDGQGRALNDAIVDALPLFEKAKHQKKVLLVLSSGADANSKANRPRLTQAAQLADVQLFIVLADGEESLTGRDTGTIRQAAAEMAAVAAVSGGRTDYTRGFDELETMLGNYGKELTGQYQLTFPRGAGKDGQYHQLKVTTDKKNLIVRHRVGYPGI